MVLLCDTFVYDVNPSELPKAKIKMKKSRREVVKKWRRSSTC